MQQHPRWQYNQWTQQQQQHRGPRPLMQLNLGNQYGSFHPYHRQAGYNMTPYHAPGMGWGHNQVSYGSIYRMNMIQSFPPNMRGHSVQRNVTSKPSWGNKMTKPPATVTKPKIRNNFTAILKENYPEYMANVNKSKTVNTSRKVEKKSLVPSVKECPVNSASRKDANAVDTLSKIEKDAVILSNMECPENAAFIKEANNLDTLCEIEKDATVLPIKELPVNSASGKEPKTVDTLSKIEKDANVPSIKECPMNSSSRKETRTVDALSEVEEDVILPSSKESPVSSSSSSHDESGISYRIVNSNAKKVILDDEVEFNNNDLEDQDMSCINISSSSEYKSEDDYAGVINEEIGTDNDEAKNSIKHKNNHCIKSGSCDKPINSNKRQLESDIESLPIKKIKTSNEPHSNNMKGIFTWLDEALPSITQEEVTDYCPNGHSLRKCYSTVNVKTDVISVFCKRCKTMIYMG